MTFLKVILSSLDLTWSSTKVAIHALLPHGFWIESNDLAANHYRKVTSVRISETIVQLLHRHFRSNRWIEAAEVKANLNADLYSRPMGWRESGIAQADFVTFQDATTGRMKRLYPMQKEQRKWFTGTDD